MKIILCSIFTLFLTQAVLAQDTLKVANDDDQVFIKVEKEPQFTGGDTAWRKYLERNLKASTPVDNGAPIGTYTVVVRFIVTRNGHIRDVTAATNFGYGMEKEVIRIIENSPKWIAGMQNGRTVNAYKRQPVTFVVEAQ